VKELKFSTPKLQYYSTYTDKQKVNMSVLTIAEHRSNIIFLLTVCV